MEKEIKIIPPEGYEIDRNNSSLEKIVFKKKDIKPRSWEEYCKQQVELRKKGHFIATASNFIKCNWANMTFPEMWKNVLPSEELAEAFLAMMQLMSLRQAWIGDWNPNLDGKEMVYTIVYNRVDNTPVIEGRQFEPASLFFQNIEIAKEFINCFKDLLEIAKPLI